MKILLIDDERDFTELTGTLLQFHDLDAETVNNPLDVEKVLQSNHYDLIVTDLMMPHLNGFQLIDKIRSLPPYASVPIIVLTAKPLNDEERKRLLQHGVHLQMKPFEPLGLVEQIRQLLGQA